MKIEPKAQDEGNGGPMDPTDGRPYLRTGCTLTWGANHLFIFGGALAYGEKQKMNDLFITNLDLMVWRKADPGGDRPSERDGHAAVYDRASKRLLIFGGRNADEVIATAVEEKFFTVADAQRHVLPRRGHGAAAHRLRPRSVRGGEVQEL